MRYRNIPEKFSFGGFKGYEVSVNDWKHIHEGIFDASPEVTNVCSLNFIDEVERNRQAMWDIVPTERGIRKGRIAVRNSGAWGVYDYVADYDNDEFQCFFFGNNGEALVYNHYNPVKGIQTGAVSDLVKKHYPTEEGQLSVRQDAMVLVIAVDVFMRHAKVRTVELGPRKKQKVKGERMFNETPGNIRVYDTRFFTNTVGVPFGVTGHTRMQPYGPGRKLVRPVWIDPYTKKGVNRKSSKS